MFEMMGSAHPVPMVRFSSVMPASQAVGAFWVRPARMGLLVSMCRMMAVTLPAAVLIAQAIARRSSVKIPP